MRTAFPVDETEIRLIERVFPPSRRRPDYDVPRFWSNPDLDDPVRVTALVLERPTIEDLARTVVAYGGRHVLEVLTSLGESGEFTPYQYEAALDLTNSALKGVVDAARELAQA
jgi:hypothetical protein